jgi:hypothetical protein
MKTNIKIVLISGSLVFTILMIGIVGFASLFSFTFNNSQVIESEITIIAYSTLMPTDNPLLDETISVPTLDSNNIIFINII